MTIDISEESLAKESADLLKILLKDRTTKKSIVWATHSYELLGKDLLQVIASIQVRLLETLPT